MRKVAQAAQVATKVEEVPLERPAEGPVARVAEVAGVASRDRGTESSCYRWHCLRWCSCRRWC